MIYWRDYKISILPTYEYKGKYYTNAIMSFDTETTTAFYINNKWVAQDYNVNSAIYSDAKKKCWVYIWQMAINEDVIYGRDIKEWFRFWNRFCAVNSSINIVYVHNLGYDFEFINEYMPEDVFVFARAQYKPMYVRVPSMSLEMRCSYMLTNMSLEKCVSQFGLSVNKLVGNLAYNVLRLPNTPLTDDELLYCEFDVRVINSLIREVFLGRYECIADIPLTQTGEVRRDVKACLSHVPYHLNNMMRLKPNLEMYKILTKLLQGGYTHLNAIYCGKIISDVVSFDKSSSYPDVMCTRLFPVGQFRLTDNYVRGDKAYSYLMYIRCENIRARGCWPYISRHKVNKSEGCINDNGKIAYCDMIELWVTDIDYNIITDCYDIGKDGKIEILKIYKAYKDYLPREFILKVLEYYDDKTTLKGVEEMSAFYMRQKQKLNACFGMSITNDIRNEVVFNPFSRAWENGEPLTDEQIVDKLYKQKPFLSYAWGVWVTAYARNDIFRVLCEIDFDAVYSDTDSIKMINSESHVDVINRFNIDCDKRIERVCQILDIPKEKFYPFDKKGIVHPLGYLEKDGVYSRFLSLGAKKYCYEHNGEFVVTVAGLQKSYIDKDGEHATIKTMNEFRVGNSVRNARTIHWHITGQETETISDGMNNTYTVTNTSGIAIMRADYTFGISDDYTDFLRETRNKYTDITRLLY